MDHQTIADALHFRFATKKFDTTRKLDDATVNAILESGRLAPSSYGLQPWKFIVVENPEVRTKLKAAAYGQAQVSEASHLVVLCTRKDMSAAHVDNYMQSIHDTRGTSLEHLDGFKQMILGSVAGNSDVLNWNRRQVYIALGFMLETAALLGVDSGPIEGFDPKAFDEILGLTTTDYGSVVVLVLGNSAEDRPTTKVRFPASQVIEFVR